MKFAIISHACLYVEHAERRILIDPWLVGSCYWRSWWNFPEPDPELVRSLAPDAIYLTHLHWDHFHGPSLARFPSDLKIYIPRAATDRMVRDLAQMGFSNVEEIPHAGRVRLGGGLEAWSYQFGPTIDSAIVLTDGHTVLLNVNDCKIFGAPLRQITRRFSRIDFVFRSHSSASPVPYCIEGYDPESWGGRRQLDWAEEFTRFAMGVRTRYAIPFASNHCFLHRDTRRFNATATTPELVARHCHERARTEGLETRCVVMPPGSTWSDTDGFVLKDFDYTDRDQHIASLLEKHRDALEQQYQLEARTPPDYHSFERYFHQMIADVPGWLRRILGLSVEFTTCTPDGTSLYWLVDFGAGQVEAKERPGHADLQIAVHPTVLNDCTRRRMFSVWTPSKRLTIRLRSRGGEKLGQFLWLLDLYEYGWFPPRRLLSRRPLGTWLRRWREALEAARLVVRHKLLGRPFVPAELYPIPVTGALRCRRRD